MSDEKLLKKARAMMTANGVSTNGRERLVHAIVESWPKFPNEDAAMARFLGHPEQHRAGALAMYEWLGGKLGLEPSE